MCGMLLRDKNWGFHVGSFGSGLMQNLPPTPICWFWGSVLRLSDLICELRGLAAEGPEPQRSRFGLTKSSCSRE